ncbi:MAG: hypothetical protein IKW00_04640 [Clostridia bacterium]|nr:hypothetical protein [Clostridia bacterium]
MSQKRKLAVPALCADEVVCRHYPSHGNRRMCRGNAAAALSPPAGDTTYPHGRPITLA